MSAHDSHVWYSIDDDGVHLDCAVCRVEVLRKHGVTLEQMNAAWAEHVGSAAETRMEHAVMLDGELQGSPFRPFVYPSAEEAARQWAYDAETRPETTETVVSRTVATTTTEWSTE